MTAENVKSLNSVLFVGYLLVSHKRAEDSGSPLLGFTVWT